MLENITADLFMDYRERFDKIYNRQLDNGWSFQEVPIQIDSFLEELRTKGKLDQTSKILDLGCGRGRMISHLEKSGYTKVSGVDISQSAAKSANQMAHNHFVSVADGTSLPFPTGCFQLVTELTLLSSLNPTLWPKVLGEIKRVLTKDGYFISEMFSRNSGDNISDSISEPLINRSQLPFSLDQVYGVKELEVFEIFSRFFNIISCKPNSPTPSRKRYFMLAQNK